MPSRLRGITSREQRNALLARVLPRRSDWIALALIAIVIVVGTALRVHVIGSNDRVSTDEGGYVANANQILRDHPIATFKWAPGTSLMFAAAAILRGTSHISLSIHSHGVAQYAQLLVELATLVLVAILAWILAGPWAALIAVAMMATYEPLIDITRTYLSEPLGALALLSMVVSICWARKRDLHALVIAGVIAGLAGLVREDYAVAVGVIMLGMLASGFPSRRAALGRAVLYGLTALVVVAPFVVYASIRTHRFTPIVDAGPHALFLGTYLPGGGNQFIDLQVTDKQVCDYFNARRPDAAQRALLSLPKDYCHIPPGDAQGLFAMIQAQHPGESNQQAAQDAAFHNLDHYMLGRPLSFAHMLIKKAWNMWSYPWSGGNSVGGGGLARTTSLLQHQIYSVIAWLGILLGLVLLRRRWAYVVPVIALVAIAWLDTFFAITPRDNVRFMPLVFTYGAIGLASAAAALARRYSSRRAASSSAAPA